MLALVGGLGAAGCGKSDPKSAVTQAELQAALKGAPAPLAKLYSKGGQLVGGGAKAYEAQIAELKGYPIVVNKWASWCGPCRAEFPYFQEASKKHGKKIAFMAIDGEDNDEDAREFLKKYPVPYPSFTDPRDDLSKQLRASIGFPTTSFYDKSGKLVYTKPGGYSSAGALEKDLEQYAGAAAKAPETRP